LEVGVVEALNEPWVVVEAEFFLEVDEGSFAQTIEIAPFAVEAKDIAIFALKKAYGLLNDGVVFLFGELYFRSFGC
jgi:hypothetical protein